MSSSVAPPPPPPPPGPPPAPSTLLTVPRAPDALLRLPAAQVLEVRLLTLAQGVATFDGGPDIGQFSLRTALALPEGARLTLQMLGTRGDSAQLRLVALDGKPLSPALPDLAQQQAAPQGGAGRAGLALSQGAGRGHQPLPLPVGATTTGGAGTAAVTVSLGSGQAVEGVVLRAPPGGLSLGPGTAPLAAGTQLSLRVSPMIPGASTPAIATPTPAGGTASLAAPVTLAAPGTPAQAAAAPMSTPTAPTPSTPAPGLQTPPPSLASGPPSPAQPSASATPGPTSSGSLGTLSGTVASNSAGGSALVRVGDGLIALSGRSELPTNATVSLEVLGRVAPPPPSPPPPAPLAQPLAALPPGPGASAWPTLSESLDLLARTDPQAARQLAAVIPAGDQRLVANVVAYAAALRAGDTRLWPGEGPLKALERAGQRGRALGQRLGEEVRELGARARDGGGGEWRTLQMPFMGDAGIDRIEVITRRLHGGEDEEEKKRKRGGQEGGQRFLISLTLSALGPVQVDGLFTAGERRLDIILRTTAELPAEMRRDIQGIVARNAAALDIMGTVTFRAGDRFPGPEEPSGGTAVTA